MRVVNPEQRENEARAAGVVPYRTDPANVLERIASRLEGRVGKVEVQRNAGSDVDVVVRGYWGDEALLLRAAEDSDIARSRRKDGTIKLRLVNACIERLGQRLEASDDQQLTTSLGGRRFIVDYCDPNATKPLHVGHLRNVALGHGIASALRACAAEVACQTVVCDIGRSVCEAMAGYLMYSGPEPAAGARAQAEFVGKCYAAYVAGTPREFCVAEPDEPIARELGSAGDLADELMLRWRAGEADVRILAQRVTTWALRGQENTLQRLGVSFERTLLESSAFAPLEPLVRRGIVAGLFRFRDDGVLVYDTGREDYETLSLARSDGFPTEHLRGIGVWAGLESLLADVDACIHVMGDEWLTATILREDVVSHLAGNPTLFDAYRTVPHGMVTGEDGRAMKSSAGDALLIDSVLEFIETTDSFRGLAEGQSAATVAALLRSIVLAPFATAPATRRIVLAPGRLLDPASNPGWTVARAWARAAAVVGAPTPDPEDPAYRYLVLQSQQAVRVLHRTLETLDMSILWRYTVHLATWYIGTRPSPPIDRAARGLLAGLLNALGCRGVT